MTGVVLGVVFPLAVEVGTPLANTWSIRFTYRFLDPGPGMQESADCLESRFRHDIHGVGCWLLVSARERHLAQIKPIERGASL